MKSPLAMGVALALGSLCLASFASGQSITSFDTVYTPAGYPEGSLRATVYLPQGVPNNVGVVLVHGADITRSTASVWADSFAVHGYLAMSIDYPDPHVDLSAVYPQKTRAAKTAVQFLRRNAPGSGIRGIPSNHVVGWGMSQGAETWGEAIIWDNDHVYFGTDPSVSDHIDAAVLLYGDYDSAHNGDTAFIWRYFSHDSSRYMKGTCILHVANIATPVLLLHGTADGTNPYLESEKLNDSLAALSRSTELVPFAGLGHEFDVNTSSGYTLTSAGVVAWDTVLAYLQRSPLPIQLASLSAEAEPEGDIVIRWNTLSEIKNYGFYVQRSLSEDGSFDDIPGSFTPGHGTTLAPHSYSFTDKVGRSGLYFYRLEQIDLDGTVHMSPVIQVRGGVPDPSAIPATFVMMQNYPNPFNPGTTIRYGLPWRTRARLTVFNALGQEVATLVDGEEDGGSYEAKFDGTGLASGVYFYRLQAGNFVRTMKFLLLR